MGFRESASLSAKRARCIHDLHVRRGQSIERRKFMRRKKGLIVDNAVGLKERERERVN